MNLLQDLRASMPGGMTRPIGVKPEGSKVDRMVAQSAKIEAGHVYLPNSASWLGEFLTELLSFPYGRHDDQVDSVSQFLRWLQKDAYLNGTQAAALFTVAAQGIQTPDRALDCIVVGKALCRFVDDGRVFAKWIESNSKRLFPLDKFLAATNQRIRFFFRSVIRLLRFDRPGQWLAQHGV
jgi:hypothetical protein